MINRLLDDVARAAGVESFSVWVYLSELPRAAMAEFGHVLPQPGEEQTWIDSLSEEDRVRIQGMGGLA